MFIQILALTAPLALPTALQHPEPEASAEAAVAWQAADEDRAREAQQARPWLGVSLAGEGDLEVVEVHAGSPADQAGVRIGDRLVALDGHDLSTYPELSEALAARRPGDGVSVLVERPILADLSEARTTDDGRPLLGVYLDGNRITDAQEALAAAQAGLRKGDRIVAIGPHRTVTADDIIAALSSIEPEVVDLAVVRSLKVSLGARPVEAQPRADAAIPEWPRLDPDAQADAHGDDEWLPEGFREGRAPRGFRGRFAAPGEFSLRSDESLRAELRSLNEELATLRAEIAALREVLAEMQHATHGKGTR